MFGNPETTSGGNALKFYASVRLDIRRIGALKTKVKDKITGDKVDKVVGNKVRVKVVKNKLAPPFKEVETELIFGYGFNKEGEILDMAYDLDIIEMTGSWYNYKSDRIGRGRFPTCKVLQENKDLYKSILADIKLKRA
jgi:recombination protein RecA